MLSNRIKSTFTTTVLVTAASGFLSACGEDYEEVEANEVLCVTEDGTVVDDDYCDDDEDYHSGGVFILGNFGGTTYRTGDRVSSSHMASVAKVNPRDPVARSRAGLPSTGRVVSGTRISGGIGSGVGGGTGGKSGTGAGS